MVHDVKEALELIDALDDDVNEGHAIHFDPRKFNEHNPALVKEAF